jgi:hypothetical protein
LTFYRSKLSSQVASEQQLKFIFVNISALATAADAAADTAAADAAADAAAADAAAADAAAADTTAEIAAFIAAIYFP